jgi:hypothetical protein
MVVAVVPPGKTVEADVFRKNTSFSSLFPLVGKAPRRSLLS